MVDNWTIGHTWAVVAQWRHSSAAKQAIFSWKISDSLNIYNCHCCHYCDNLENMERKMTDLINLWAFRANRQQILSPKTRWLITSPALTHSVTQFPLLAPGDLSSSRISVCVFMVEKLFLRLRCAILLNRAGGTFCKLTQPNLERIMCFVRISLSHEVVLVECEDWKVKAVFQWQWIAFKGLAQQPPPVKPWKSGNARAGCWCKVHLKEPWLTRLATISKVKDFNWNLSGILWDENDFFVANHQPGSTAKR